MKRSSNPSRMKKGKTGLVTGLLGGPKSSARKPRTDTRDSASSSAEMRHLAFGEKPKSSRSKTITRSVRSPAPPDHDPPAYLRTLKKNAEFRLSQEATSFFEQGASLDEALVVITHTSPKCNKLQMSLERLMTVS